MSKIIAEYEAVTGERFEDALKRLARNGCCGYQAAECIGFTSKQGLDYAMRKRGIEVAFRKYRTDGKTDRAMRYRRAKLKQAEVPEVVTTSKTPAEHPWRKLNREIRRNKEV